MGFIYDMGLRRARHTNGGVGELKLNVAEIIVTITTADNWDGGGNYTGYIEGLARGHAHYDDANKLRYYFDGTTLRRNAYNA